MRFWVTEKIQLLGKGGMSHVFRKPLTSAFPKKMPQANLLWRLKSFGCHGRIFLIV
jgi:hypothetical protein